MTLSQEHPSDELTGQPLVQRLSQELERVMKKDEQQETWLAKKTRPPSTSWWTEADFKAAHQRELGRMRSSPSQVMPPRTGAPVEP